VNNIQLVTQVIQQQQVAQTVLVQNTQAPVNTPAPPTQGTATTPPAPLATTDNFQVIDEADQIAFHTPGSPYTGTTPEVQNQYININPINLDITAITPNAFIKSGDGDDSISAYYGRNVLDAGGGSNALIGGVGLTTFLATVPNASSPTTVVDVFKNFHAGDDAIIRGLSPTDFSLTLSDITGAFGPELLLQATPNGQSTPTATVAIAGYSQADVGGRLTVSSSVGPDGIPFTLIHAIG
jgi:hypothetical protein